MTSLRIAYFGTPSFAGTILQNIVEDIELPVELSLVVTQPDKKVGKKQIITPSPVKVIAQQNNIQIYDGSAKSPELIRLLQDLQIDVVLLFAYGEIITKDVLDIPRFGFWNIHPSLLPLYRGASPITYPLLCGDKETGVTLMLMDEKLDHGPIIAQQKVEIQENAKRSDLEGQLTELAYKMFKVKITEVANTEILKNTIDQNHENATFTRMLHKNDGYVPFTILKDAYEGKNVDYIPKLLADYYEKNLNTGKKNLCTSAYIANLFQALYPWPGVWTKIVIQGVEKRLKITSCYLKDNRLCIEKLQLEGKNEVDMKTFNTAYRLF